MVDVSTKANEHANPSATRLVNFEPSTQSFRDGEGNDIGSEGLADHLSDLLGFDGRQRGVGQGGDSTLRRYALFKSLLQSEGARRKLLEQVHREQDSGGSGVGGALEGSFYSKDSRAGTEPGLTTRQTVRDAIAENLPKQARAIDRMIQRGETGKRRAQIWEALHPAPRAELEVAQLEPPQVATHGGARPQTKAFAAATAAATGQSKATTNRALARADALGDTTLQRLEQLKL